MAAFVLQQTSVEKTERFEAPTLQWGGHNPDEPAPQLAALRPHRKLAIRIAN
jgi:hypothetical protein